jgi:putative glutathione S-transferase
MSALTFYAVYDELSPGYQGRCTAPLLVDKRTRKIVSNESSDIVRMLNQASLGQSTDSKDSRLDLYPSDVAAEIDATNEWIYHLLNNGVYRCGFSTTQTAYDRASAQVCQGLDRCQAILENQAFLCGDSFTEADLRLLPTILRYDGAYAPLFKAGGTHNRIGNYPAIAQWLQRCWNMPHVASSIDLPDACSSYYRQLFPLNPGGIIPVSLLKMNPTLSICRCSPSLIPRPVSQVTGDAGDLGPEILMRSSTCRKLTLTRSPHRVVCHLTYRGLW